MNKQPNTHKVQWIIMIIILSIVAATILSSCSATKPNPAGLRYEKKQMPTVGCVNHQKFMLKNNKVR